VSEAGVLPWASRWPRATDAFGLNDHRIATRGADLPYLESLRPDLIQFVVALNGPTAGYALYHPYSELVRTGRYEFATLVRKTNSDLEPGVPPQAHMYFVRRGAARAPELIATLRGLRTVRHVPVAQSARILRGLGYRAAPGA